MKTVVLGIGNKLLSDEGVGLHVLNALHASYPPTDEIEYLDGGTLSFTLAGAISDADNLIVIDAAQLKGKTGDVACFVNQAMDDFLGACKRSVHEIGLLDLLDISRLTESLPANRALIGIQPDKIDWGDELTAPVKAAVPQAMHYAIELLEQWQARKVA